MQATAEQKKLAVDLAEVIIKWEFQRLKEQQDHEVGSHDSHMTSHDPCPSPPQGEPMDHEPAMKDQPSLSSSSSSSSLSLKRSASDGLAESKRGQRSQQAVSDPHWVLDRQHSDAVINFLIRISCQVGWCDVCVCVCEALRYFNLSSSLTHTHTHTHTHPHTLTHPPPR